MPDWLLKLLGPTTMDPTAPGVRFEFAHPLAAWQWALVIFGAALVAWFGYRAMPINPTRRARLGLWLAATCRALAVILLAFLLTGPRFVQVQEHIEKDWVIPLLDRSASLTVTDGRGTEKITRDAELRALLARPDAAAMFAALGKDRVVKWLGFDAGAYELTLPTGSSIPALPSPTGRRTDIAAALEQALAKAAARPVAGIILFSDGKAAAPVPRTLIKRLAAERIPVLVVALGAPEGATDLAVASAVAPPSAFVSDPVPVTVTITKSGKLAAGARVKLLDTAGTTLDEQTVSWDFSDTDAPSKKLTLTGTPSAGSTEAAWRVEVLPDGGDLVPENNTADLRVALVDRPLRLLYVDGYPRWEYRFLKNLMAREKSLHFSATLLSAGKRFLQEGSDDILGLPDTPSGWDAFDVIMLGDVQPGVMTPTQLEQIRTRVSVGGAGLLWIAGQGAVPAAYRGTALADLLPVNPAGERLEAWDRDVVMKPTPLAEQLGVLRLAARQKDGSFWPAAVSDPSSGWSRLRWVQRLEPSVLKPAAEAVALAAPVDGTGTPTPLVVTMRYGAGRILYIATDEIWRFRFGRGEDLPERFYMQLVRLLGRESVARAGKPAVLTATPQQADVGQPVRVSIELIDQSLVDAKPASLTVRLTKPAVGSDQAERAEITLRPASADRTGQGRSFVGTWVPPSAGDWQAAATDALLDGKGVTSPLRVHLPDDELRHPETDHALLKQLAQETSGHILTHDTLADLPKLLPRREVRSVSTAKEETIWDRPLMLAAMLALLTIEWVTRRLIRLI